MTPRLVILGTGWGSFSLLKAINKQLYEVVVVSPRNHFLFTPLLCSTTVGTLEFRSIIEPVRNIGFRQSKDFHLSYANNVDFERKTVSCSSLLESKNEYKLEYDKLIIGVGARPNTFGIPGVKENAIFLKEITDARQIRSRLVANFEQSLQPGISDEERKRLLHTVIVGGGPTGVEFGAELYDFCKQDMLRLYKDIQSQTKVTLVEANEILSRFDKKLRDYAQHRIEKRHNFTLLKAQVSEVTENGVVLKSGAVLPSSLVVWSTGLIPQSFTKQLNVQKTKQGQILTDEYLRIKSDPSGDSYAVGDCANIDDFPLPSTAQVAQRQGAYLAKQLNRHAQGKQIQTFGFKSMGMLAYIGNYEAVSDMPAFKLKGLTSWFIWRSAYFKQIVSWRLRLQIGLDWIKTLFFGRDTSFKHIH